MRAASTFALLVLSTLSRAGQIEIVGENVELNLSNAGAYGFCVAIEKFDPVIDEFLVIIAAPTNYGARSFSLFHVGRHGSIRVETKPEKIGEKHYITLYVPESGLDAEKTEITAIYVGAEVPPVFFGINIRLFLPSVTPIDESTRCGAP